MTLARTPSLLFRQVCMLAWVGGLFAARHPLPALCAFALLLAGDWPRARVPARLALLCLCYATGWGVALVTLPETPPAPAWVTGKPQRVAGIVDDVDGLPDGRLRIMLRDVRPVLPADGASLPVAVAEEGDARAVAGVSPVAAAGGDRQDSPAMGMQATEHGAGAERPDNASEMRPLPQGTHVIDEDAGGGVQSGTRAPSAPSAPSAQSAQPAPPLPGRLVWTWEHPVARPLTGQTVTATLAVKPVRGFANPGGQDSAAYWQRRDAHFRAWSRDDMPLAEVTGAPSGPAALRAWLRERLVATLGGPQDISRGGGVLLAILFGDRFHLDSGMLDLFARTDLLHSLALSGQHLAVAGLFAGAAVLLAGRFSPGVFLRLPRRKLLLVLSLPPAAAYLWLGNAPPSLVRAALMLLFWTVLALADRPGVLLDGLLWAVGCILLFDPDAVYDLGLQLSALAVASIALSLPFAAWLHGGGHQGDSRPGTGPLPGGVAGSAGASPSGTGATPVTEGRGNIPLRVGALYGPWQRMRRALLLMALTTLAVQVALLPVQLIGFGRASPWFALNLLWLPFADLVVLPLGALGLVCEVADVTRPLAGPLLMVAALPCEGLMWLLEWMEGAGLLAVPAMLRPHWTAALGYGALVVVFASLPGRLFRPASKSGAVQRSPHAVASAADHPLGPRVSASCLPPLARRLLPCALILLLAGPVLRLHDATDDSVRVTVLDVGQGQAVAIDLPGDRRLLVDGGGFNSPRFDAGRDLVAPALTANRSPRLDMVLNTHPDTDHLRGLIHILDRFAVGHFATNGDAPRGLNARDLTRVLARTGMEETPVYAGEVLSLGDGLTLRVLHPPPHHRGSSNNKALVARLERDGRGLAVLCGDAEAPALRDIVRSGTPLQAEVLVLPHHGSASSLLPAFYDAVAPRLAIASCGADNRYGFPAAGVQAALAERGVALRTTAEAGCIRLGWAAGGAGALSVSTGRDRGLSARRPPGSDGAFAMNGYRTGGGTCGGTGKVTAKVPARCGGAKGAFLLR